MVLQIQTRIKGIEKVNKFFVQLPKTQQQEIMKKIDEFMSFVQKSAKMRAPRFTGALARSIRLKKLRKNEVRITVDSPYGIFQEFGFRPHYVQLYRSTRAGGTVADWAAAHGIQPTKNSIFVSQFKPFITPALEAGLNQLPFMLSDGTKKAIRKARS
jgi:hypothetical protein